jgi:hypothetical protein
MQVDAEVPCFTLTLAKPVTVDVAYLRTFYGGILHRNADICRLVRAAWAAYPDPTSAA